ncbi:cytochrome c-type biogenesis protein [Bosea sp. (in: a-proteobacteria)]|uniref:cytochrome c-type biogenesis protein n=1 Tax=Bosea sp. (in: a-proteobacteria) TaxID=1871050 RepID=UPI00260F31ED|nr:cytochrome c-type biogenesis protein [Bosea sp. (in: a-proteobacteria)]MCO5092564.1 cytochrome c-type biogenesis protein CcmH [Bosea sp. (in: a-proteobacteria)]
MRRIALALFLLLLVSPAARAVQPDEILRDPVLEQRARDISAGLRCLVCQNQSIDDSDAPLARDLRILVRERLTAGDDDKAVVAFVVARYGDFVLLRPPFNAHTLMLWAAPFLILLAGAGFVWRRGRQRAGEEPATPAPLTEEERQRVDSLLRDEPE